MEMTDGKAGKPGNIVDTNGKILGKHKGLSFYTIGQRKGLGIAQENPLYVIELDSKRNCVVVGPNEMLFKDNLIAENINLISLNNIKELDEMECWQKRVREINFINVNLKFFLMEISKLIL